MKKTALVIMAAGIGSRFGKGIKQLAKVGPSGEIIMDYSIHDALEAGFNKIVFIIRKDIEEEFREVIGNRIEKTAEVEYVFQDLHDLPEGFTCPQKRTKPWGTGQAILAAKDVLSEPFIVINADDYYGKEAYVKIHDYLVEEHQDFILENTLSDNGSVTRGICSLDDNKNLVGIAETYNIKKTAKGPAVENEDKSLRMLDPKNLVSMNMWGLTPAFLKTLEEGFVEFLKECGPEDLKKEYLLPTIVDKLIKEQKADVAVLKSHDTWFGVTYQEDKEKVTEAFSDLVRQGVYAENLYA